MEALALTADEAKTTLGKDFPQESKDVCKISDSNKTSVDCLRVAKPVEDLSVKAEHPEIMQSEKRHQLDYAPKQEEPGDQAKIETVFKKPEMSAKSESVTDADVVDTIPSDPQIPIGMGSLRDRAYSIDDPFLIHNQRNAASGIYSVTGKPSGRINRRITTSNVFPAGCMGCTEDVPLDQKTSSRRFIDAKQVADCVGQIDNTPKKRCSSARPESSRNPLTGDGIEPPDARRQTGRRKDGNPLLGLGYENSTARPKSPNSTGRVPPGGFSHGLW